MIWLINSTDSMIFILNVLDDGLNFIELEIVKI
jgi:hypothetical protein